MLGHPVVYRVPAGHHNTTVKVVDGKEVETEGSVHHHEMREFAGQVVRSHDDGTHDLVLFPPGKSMPVYVEKVKHSDGGEPGTFSHPKAHAKAK